MTSLLDNGPVRAGVFFAGGLSVSVITGAIIGAPRLGVRMGMLAGLVLAVFGWLFVRPTNSDRREP